MSHDSQNLNHGARALEHEGNQYAGSSNDEDNLRIALIVVALVCLTILVAYCNYRYPRAPEAPAPAPAPAPASPQRGKSARFTDSRHTSRRRKKSPGPGGMRSEDETDIPEVPAVRDPAALMVDLEMNEVQA